MEHYKYVIVGAGMTGASAAKAIREVDAHGSIALFGAEPHPPYDRPPLSKKLWAGKPIDTIWRKTDETDAALHLGVSINAIDPSNKIVTDGSGNSYGYEKLLLANGGTPRRLSSTVDGVVYFRTLDDYYRLRKAQEQGADFAVIGAGFIGSEVAAALAQNGLRVTMIFPGSSIGEHVYPRALAQFITQYYRDRGVSLLTGESTNSVTQQDGRFSLQLKSGRTLSVGCVVAGLGIEPNIDLARAAGLEVDRGVVVDEALRTSNPDIYAAGDLASFYSSALETRRRVEHEDNANTMGAVAGRNMAGRSERYDYMPYFYSDLFDLGYEAVGEIDSRLDIVEDWKEPFHKGVVYYLKNGYVRGVLLWNTWGQVDAARQLIGAKKTFDKTTDLKGRIRD